MIILEQENKGGFTLPGESGYEELTLKLAEKWGADVIRDSDGTRLSDELLNAGYGIYSTVCVIRDHNEWAKANPDKLQQTVLCTLPELCIGDTLTIHLMNNFFNEQLVLNDSPESITRWQVYDRTDNTELSRENWNYSDGAVTIRGKKWHKYAVNFFAWRVWEEINMYNHTTNNWTSEHLMQIDPVYPETMDYLRSWMRNWCVEHKDTNVVRFTSLFYNFVWIWGNNERNRHLFTDWASYDFTVSPKAMELFEKKYGEAITLEDFVNKGLHRSTHTVPDSKKRTWMAFINDLVITAGRELIDIVHEFGKKAYVFYDDSWVGLEPTNGRFTEFGFDGIIKCVFSGFETRLCSAVPCETHEIRLHPYLFPVGLGGAPTFMQGGNPTADAKRYWMNVRRALLRQPVDRIGLGGYLHLTEDFPDFQDCIAEIAQEFLNIKSLHEKGSPYVLKPKVAILHAWGSLRSWTLSGHFHETDSHLLMHINECLAGLPFDVSFISFDDIRDGVSADIDVIINAGRKGSAWSGGELWDDKVVESITEWVYNGGGFIGAGEPSSMDGYDTYLRLSHVLGMDIDDGRYACHGKWRYEVETSTGLLAEGSDFLDGKAVVLRNENTKVYVEKDGVPVLTKNQFGKGYGIYLPGIKFNSANAKTLQNLILLAAKQPFEQEYITDNAETECAWFAESGCFVLINNSDKVQKTAVKIASKNISLELNPYEIIMKNVGV